MYIFELEFSVDTWPGIGLLDHMVVLILIFKRTSILLSVVAIQVYIPTNNIEVFPFFHTFFIINYCRHFNGGYCDWREMYITVVFIAFL